MGMNRGVRIVLALSIVVGGTGAAMLFRREGTSTANAPPGATEPPLVLRDRSSAESPGVFVREFPLLPPRFSQADMRQSPPTGADKPATIVTPVRIEGSPPSLPKDYPGAEPSNWGAPMTLGPPPTAPPAKLVRHKIIDGDTLPSLAKRYLGDKERYREIFEINRDVLSSPELLPIGRQLKIPARAVGSRQ